LVLWRSVSQIDGQTDHHSTGRPLQLMLPSSVYVFLTRD
jgi:hypothetical protein